MSTTDGDKNGQTHRRTDGQSKDGQLIAFYMKEWKGLRADLADQQTKAEANDK